jgi:hypothetical protein
MLARVCVTFRQTEPVPVSLTVGGGDLTITPDGILFEPFRGRGVQTWAWADVIQLAFDEDEAPLMRGGLLGLALRRRLQSLVVVTTTDEDHVMEAEEPLAELRSVARRIVATCPNAVGRVSVGGQQVR